MLSEEGVHYTKSISFCEFDSPLLFREAMTQSPITCFPSYFLTQVAHDYGVLGSDPLAGVITLSTVVSVRCSSKILAS